MQIEEPEYNLVSVANLRRAGSRQPAPVDDCIGGLADQQRRRLLYGPEAHLGPVAVIGPHDILFHKFTSPIALDR